jgi:hypothetical protein
VGSRKNPKPPKPQVTKISSLRAIVSEAYSDPLISSLMIPAANLSDALRPIQVKPVLRRLSESERITVMSFVNNKEN